MVRGIFNLQTNEKVMNKKSNFISFVLGGWIAQFGVYFYFEYDIIYWLLFAMAGAIITAVNFKPLNKKDKVGKNYILPEFSYLYP